MCVCVQTREDFKLLHASDWTRTMSSGYKIKGHQRSRSAKPYERKAVSTNKTIQVRRKQSIEIFQVCVVCGVSRLYFSPNYVRVHCHDIFFKFL